MFGLFFPRGRTPCGSPSVSRRIWQRWEKGRAMWWWWPGLASGSFRKNERPVRRNHSRYARDPAPQTSFLQGTPVLPHRTCSALASGTALFLTLPHLHKNLQPPPPRNRLPHFHRRRRRAEPAGRQARPRRTCHHDDRTCEAEAVRVVGHAHLHHPRRGHAVPVESLGQAARKNEGTRRGDPRLRHENRQGRHRTLHARRDHGTGARRSRCRGQKDKDRNRPDRHHPGRQGEHHESGRDEQGRGKMARRVL